MGNKDSDIKRLSFAIYGELSIIETCLERGDYSDADKAIKSAKSLAYECLEIMRKKAGNENTL